MTFDDDELDYVIDMFNKEEILYRKMLKSEIKQIVQEGKWEVAGKIIEEYGFR